MEARFGIYGLFVTFVSFVQQECTNPHEVEDLLTVVFNSCPRIPQAV